MRRCVRLNFYRQDDSTVDQLFADVDDGLFAAVLSSDRHVLRFIANLRCSTQCHDVTTMQYKSVLHGYIARMYSCACTFTAEAENSPLCEQQHGIRQANLRFAGCIIRIIEVEHSLCH